MKDFDVVQRLDIIRSISSKKKVLHLGCTDFPYTEQSIKNAMLLHFELREICERIVGIDYDERGLEILRDHGCEDLFRADLEDLEALQLDETFDVIVAGEMIEHLNNPGLFLTGIKRFMNPSTKLVITTVNAYCAMRFFQYGVSRKLGKTEPVHPDHTFYFSYSTLSLLLNRSGFAIDKFLYYDLGKEHRPHARTIAKLTNDVFVRLSPQLADGLIAICTLR